ncbi:MAG: hypothetical protein HDR31_00330 [Mycoplasma sp.]|nr:hypothetical protein [Mycoplasma sp.]
MKKSKDYKKLPIKELFDSLDAKQDEHKKVIAIAGKINTKKTRLLNSIYDYKKSSDLALEDENLTDFQRNIKENSLSIKAEKENKRKIFLKFESENNKSSYKNITSVSLENFIKDIGWILRENLIEENTYQWKHFKIIGKIYNKYLIKKILKKINALESNWKKSFYTNKTKMIFPVLTTISTIGTSIGVPILSISFFRQEEIIKTISWGGYIGVLSFCAILIGIGIISVIAYLFSVVFVNKTDYLVQNLSDGYAKLISKYFLLLSQDETKTKGVKRKIRIRKSYNLFYNEIYYSDSHFNEYMKLIMIIHALNNNVTLTLNINDKFEFKQIFSSQWGSSKNYMILDVESYKVGFSNNHIVSFLLSELSKSLDFDTKNLYRKNKNFSFIINTFCEMTTHSLQLVEFLSACKNLFKNNLTNLLNNKTEMSFLLDVFSLISFKALNSFDFSKFVQKLQNEFELTQSISETYSALQIKQILASNWNKYGLNSLAQNLGNLLNEQKDFFSSNSNLPSLRKNDYEKQENEIINFFTKKDFEKTSTKKVKTSSFEMVNKIGDEVSVFSLNYNNEDFNVFDEIKKIKEKCMKEDILFIAINLGDYYLIFQQKVGKYHLISNSIN